MCQLKWLLLLVFSFALLNGNARHHHVRPARKVQKTALQKQNNAYSRNDQDDDVHLKRKQKPKGREAEEPQICSIRGIYSFSFYTHPIFAPRAARSWFLYCSFGKRGPPLS